MKTNRELGLKVLTKFLGRQKDRDLIEKSYDVSMGEEVYPHKQYPTLAGINTVLEPWLRTTPKPKKQSRRISSTFASSENWMRAVTSIVSTRKPDN